jgi:iron(III) transport system substrate-binding protein
MVKGDSYLTRLAQQELLITQNHRQAGEMLAKGRLALTLGLSYYTMLPFIQAKLPVKPLPTPKEGVNTTSGSGALTIVKDPPHPNATKVFVNWLLSKEGQEIFGKAMGTPSRRLDVDTKWMEEGFGVQAVKDHLTLEEYYRRQIDLEDHYTLLRVPAAEMAEKLLK